MKRKIGIIIFIILAAAAAFLGYKIYKNRKKGPEPEKPGNGGSGSGSSSSSSSSTGKYSNDNFPLKLYSGGERVKTVQRWLNWTGKNKNGKLTVDGKWGSKTEAEMKKWNIYNDSQLSEGEYSTSILRELNSGYPNFDAYKASLSLQGNSGKQTSYNGDNLLYEGAVGII